LCLIERKAGDFGNKQNPLYGKTTDTPKMKNWTVLGGSVIYADMNEDGSYKFGIRYFRDENNDMICVFLEYAQCDENSNSKCSRILDTVKIGKLNDNEIFAPCLCRMNSVLDSEIIAIAVLENDKEFYDKIVRAWRADTKTGRIKPIDIDGIDCTNEGHGV
jgi:hypothetical protein